MAAPVTGNVDQLAERRVDQLAERGDEWPLLVADRLAEMDERQLAIGHDDDVLALVSVGRDRPGNSGHIHQWRP